MSLIEVSHLTFAYEGSYDSIFQDVSFQIDSDWKLGLVGRNGRGKTTLLQLFLGSLNYAGSITSGVSFAYFPFWTDASKSAMETIRMHCPEAEDWQILRELSYLQVSESILDHPFGTLSHGEQTKALLASLFLNEDRFLLIDEPTNHLDADGRKAVSEYLNRKRGFIVVSHDRAFLDGCVDHILSINRADIEIQKGNFSSWWHNRQLQDSFELAQNEKLKKDIQRLKSAAERTSTWSDKVEKTKRGTENSGLKPDTGYIGHKAAKMAQRSKSMENRQQLAVEEKSRLLKNLEEPESLKLSPLPFYTARFAELENISVFYGDRAVCEHVNFTVEQGDRIALVGKNGCGKSSLLKLICGEELQYHGVLRRSSQLIISYVPQGTADLTGSLTEYARRYNLDESLLKAILRKMDFSRVQFEKDMGLYSGGQKKKVLIARSLCEKAHLYIWDEPLNYIDVFSRMQIEELLLAYKPTLLFVEHDQAFCNSISTKTVRL